MGDILNFSSEEQMNAALSAVEWTREYFKAFERWPEGLRGSVQIVLQSKFPMMLWRKDEKAPLCNLSCAEIFCRLEVKDVSAAPAQLALNYTGHFAEFVQHVLLTGSAVYHQDYPMGAEAENTGGLYCDFSCSPVFGAQGNVEGVFVVCSDTTAKVNAHKKLVLSDKRFECLVKEAQVGIIVLEGEDNNIVIVNDAYLKLVDRSYSELFGRKLFEAIPESRPYFESIIDTVRSTGEPRFLGEHPYFVINSEGGRSEGFLNLVYQPHRGDENHYGGVMVLCSDVTELVLSRNKIKYSEMQVRALVESAPFPIGVYEGHEMRITLANQAIKEVWGKGSDVVGKSYFDVLPELEEQDIYPKLTDVYRKGIPFHARSQRVDLHVNERLQTFYFNYSFTPLFDENGMVYGVLNTAADVTDLNVGRIKVEQVQQNFRNLILQAPVSMCLLLGPEHRVEVANDAMIDLWGKAASEVMDRPIFEGLPDAREQGLEQLLDHVYNTGETFTASEMPVNLVRFGNAETTYQNFIYEPYRDGSGKVAGVIAISNNVTQQVLALRQIEQIVKQRTEQLEAANENLVRSNSGLAQFAYIASHDLQEPLRKISIFSQMLDAKAGPSLDEKSQMQLRKINESSQRMQALISDVLAYSQLNREAGEFVPVDLNQTAVEIISDMELLIEQKNAVIDVSTLPTLPGQPLQLSQLLGNLISNSLKFQKPGSIPRIKIESFEVDESERSEAGLEAGRKFVKITLSDNGVGFSEQDAEKIFGLFQRLHGRSEFEGTGIGLSICSQIVKNHHGVINAKGSSEKGAVFNIYLPA